MHKRALPALERSDDEVVAYGVELRALFANLANAHRWCEFDKDLVDRDPGGED